MILGKGWKGSSQLAPNYGRIAAAVSPKIYVQIIYCQGIHVQGMHVQGFMSEQSPPWNDVACD